MPLVPVTVNVLLPFFALPLVEAVSFEVMLLPLIETDVGFTPRLSPVLAPLVARATLPVNPFAGVTVTVYLALPPRFTDCEAGEMLTLKEGCAGWLMTRLAEVVRTSEPLVPWMLNEEVPEAGLTAVTVNVPLVVTGLAAAQPGSPRMA